ncbi:hypothetical protein KY290_000635 [Solanum tuberosum]|uniref:Polyprotein protein n=1 Tax=Solanum tuberosum TaxID=4113 RepID=A0ABQ7WM46_SOLTU|nr:hypothetical protein KY289_000702 [Solanum tuberosum]KAH0781037.1 hypothetical protein KY290_000635 [Solanum tuberosum]
MEHVDQQVGLTHENEFIIIEEIAGKEISPNTPIMAVSNPEEAKNVEEEENITSPPMSKLSLQAPEFVPTSKANPSMAMTIDSFKNLTTTYDIDLGTDMSDGDDEEEMFNI